MRKQELMFKRITKLMREIIDLHDFSADFTMLTGDLGAMDLQTVTEIYSGYGSIQTPLNFHSLYIAAIC